MIQKRQMLTHDQRRGIYDKTNGCCAYCGCEIGLDEMTVDHVVSLIPHNGDDDLKNMLPACQCCNYYKGSMTVEEFRTAIEGIVIEGESKYMVQKNMDYKIGVKFGIIKPVPKKIRFYFEKMIVKKFVEMDWFSASDPENPPPRLLDVLCICEDRRTKHRTRQTGFVGMDGRWRMSCNQQKVNVIYWGYLPDIPIAKSGINAGPAPSPDSVQPDDRTETTEPSAVFDAPGMTEDTSFDEAAAEQPETEPETETETITSGETAEPPDAEESSPAPEAAVDTGAAAALEEKRRPVRKSPAARRRKPKSAPDSVSQGGAD